MASNNTNNRGLGSDNMDDSTKHKIQSAGGSADTPKQQKARKKNIKKAQEARRDQ